MSDGEELHGGHVLHPVQRPGAPIERMVRPASWQAALIALRDHPGARPVAGGTDLLLELARSGANPDAIGADTRSDPVTLVDLSAIADGRSITETDGELVLAGGVTHNQVVGDPRFRDHALPLAQACLEVGSPQLRNRATVAGNVATASPANDTISALMVLDARIELSSLGGSDAETGSQPIEVREIPVASFFTGFRSTVCRPDELITAIRVPKLRSDQRGIWVKLGLRRAQAISVVHLAIVIELGSSADADAGRVISGARCALGSVAPTVVLSEAFPRTLLEAGPTGPFEESRIAGTAAAVAAEIEPIDDLRATADYRRAVTETLVARALRALRDSAEDPARARAAWPERPPLLVTPSASPDVDPSDRSAAHGAAVGAGSPSDLVVVDDRSTVRVTLNGAAAEGTGGAGTTLLDWLRDHSSIPCRGVKEGCAEGECGACTVILDGAAVMSCLVSAAQADGADIVTVEGLAFRAGHDPVESPGSFDSSGSAGPLDPLRPLHPLQEAFISEFAVQCGFCIPGFLVAGTALLEECPSPTDEQIALGLGGNLCRCTGYYPITQAVHLAARTGAADGPATRSGEPT